MDSKLAKAIAELLAPSIQEAVREAIRDQPTSQGTGNITVYTVDEAAKALKTGREQILSYIRSGELTSFKLARDSRKNLIYENDLLDLIARLRSEAV